MPHPQNRDMILVASYGGSGSTFLAQALGRYAPNRHIVHTLASPEVDFLGWPLFNRATGHSEGPFSRAFALPHSAKVIVIWRRPAEAALSRGGMKHFLHLWSETPLAQAIAGIDPAQETFLENWRIAREDGRDILHLGSYLDRWRGYAQSGGHDVCFVRYEALNDVWPQISDFLGLKLPAEVLRQEFSPRDRDVPPDVAKRFATLENDLSACPAFVGFPKKAHAPMPAPRTQRKIDLSGSVFTVSNITAGAADAIGRIAFVHDIFSSAANIPFLLPEYKNYHSPDLDFFDLFGLYTAFNDPVTQARTDLPEVNLSLRDLVFTLIFEPAQLQDGRKYVISGNHYGTTPPLEQFRKIYGFERRFMAQLSYQPSGSVFDPRHDRPRAVVHLRRSDTCGGVLFDGLSDDEAPAQLRKGIQARDMLTLKRALEMLQQHFGKGAEIDIVLASDGVDYLARFFRNHPAVQRRIAALQAELAQHLPDCDLTAHLVDRLIGKDAMTTRRTLDAIYQADVVVTGKSQFVTLAANAGGTKILRGP